jgi:hypothetical protein
MFAHRNHEDILFGLALDIRNAILRCLEPHNLFAASTACRRWRAACKPFIRPLEIAAKERRIRAIEPFVKQRHATLKFLMPDVGPDGLVFAPVADLNKYDVSPIDETLLLLMARDMERDNFCVDGIRVMTKRRFGEICAAVTKNWPMYGNARCDLPRSVNGITYANFTFHVMPRISRLDHFPIEETPGMESDPMRDSTYEDDDDDVAMPPYFVMDDPPFRIGDPAPPW